MPNDNDDDNDENSPLDRDSIEREIAAGAKAFKALLDNASKDWTHWSATILGLRGLRSLAFEKAGTASMQAQAFRDAMSSLLTLRKYSIYDQIDKQTRSDCYRIMDHLEEVDLWYGSLSRDDKMRWKHPGTIAKHCPKEYLSGMRKHNQPKKIGKAKPVVSVETERLKALLIQVIQRLAKYEPDALELLNKIYPAEPSDSLDDFLSAAPQA
jgi:hypothetical protein